MPRSEESKAHQREYTRQWRASQRGKDYHKKWRADNRDKERERVRVWRAYRQDLVREQRRRYAEKHPRESRAIPGIPEKFQGHPFFETARFVCGDRPYFDWRLKWEEAMAEAVLALLEGRDPTQAVKTCRSQELSWERECGPIYDNVDIRDHDLQVVFVSHRD